MYLGRAAWNLDKIPCNLKQFNKLLKQEKKIAFEERYPVESKDGCGKRFVIFLLLWPNHGQAKGCRINNFSKVQADAGTKIF